MDILCGKTTFRGSHFLGSTQDVDVDSRRSFGDDDNSTRQGFSAMGLDSQQVQSIDDDNFNPFDFPPLSQPPSYENTQTQNTPIEDEATSPDKRRTTQAQSSQSRKRRSKKSSELLTLAQYCQLNDQRMKLAKSLFPGSSSCTMSKDEEQYTVRECVSRLKTMVGYSQELLMRALPLFEITSKRVVFMSLDEEDAMVVVFRYRPYSDYDALLRDAILEENAMFLAVGEMLMSSIMHEDEEDTTPIPRPMHTSRHTGHVWVHEILNGHERRCYNTFRMHPSMFLKLRDILVERELIRDSRYVTTFEQLIMFLHAMGHGVATGAMCEYFQHSSETISFYVNHVIKAIASLRFTYIVLPSETNPVHPRIRHDDRFYPYFKVCIDVQCGDKSYVLHTHVIN
ncbi:hypothetical protein Taro_010437 [Colocasia esculenta]|uniref:DUF8040 domain-containing protein n=1 Tax=Colocasia esculenta TaxID=4460 RepID=A0A843U2Z7_COLES|nr:hypothetical protein [Colocasia esculenta]